MTKEQSYAAFRKEKEKRQRKNDQLEAEKAEREKIQRELDELKATVGSIKKGSPPTLEQFEYDENKYENAVKEYYSAPQAKPKLKHKRKLKRLAMMKRILFIPTRARLSRENATVQRG